MCFLSFLTSDRQIDHFSIPLRNNWRLVKWSRSSQIWCMWIICQKLGKATWAWLLGDPRCIWICPYFPVSRNKGQKIDSNTRRPNVGFYLSRVVPVVETAYHSYHILFNKWPLYMVRGPIISSLLTYSSSLWNSPWLDEHIRWASLRRCVTSSKRACFLRQVLQSDSDRNLQTHSKGKLNVKCNWNGEHRQLWI